MLLGARGDLREGTPRPWILPGSIGEAGCGTSASEGRQPLSVSTLKQRAISLPSARQGGIVGSGYDMRGPVFISYRQADGREYAELLDHYLRAGGLVPWRDLIEADC